MTCTICGEEHPATTSCETLVRGVSPSGTLIAGVPQPGPTPLPAQNALAQAVAAGSEDPLIGQIFGSFKAVKRVGKGGMGTVYLGEHTMIGSKVAIKVLHDHLAHDAGLVQRFYDEARAVNLIGHENIVSIFDMNVLEPRRFYLIMEFLEGRTLASLARQPLDASTALPILIQICDALGAAHQRGIVHRDLKPENVFLVKRNRTEHFVKLMDFGIAKLLAPELPHEETRVGLIIGTPEYMAPEQSSGETVDGRADLYALGVMMYLIATGRLPFEGGGITGLLLAHRERAPTPPEKLNPGVSPGWSSIILKSLAKRPEDRFQTAAELACALEKLERSGEGVTVPVLVPPPSAEGLVTPEPLHSRHAAQVRTEVKDPAGGKLREMTCSDLSRGGMFLSTDSWFPPVFTRLQVTLALPDGPAACECEVVRHVNPEQARAWGMSPGFGVQFMGGSPELKDRIDRAVKGLPHAKPPARPREDKDDPVADVSLSFFQKRINGDHYVILGLPQDAEFDQVRARVREIRGELDALQKERTLSTAQQGQLEDVRARVQRALEEVGHPRARAKLDALRGNFRGVARCIAAGLTVTELEALRKDYEQGRSEKLTRAHIHFATAKAWENQGQLALALDELESALTLDPLNLEIQQRYWGIKKRAGSSRAPA